MSTRDDRKRDAVTFTFENIGPVRHADLQLGDLTIIAGPNNTGKTYLVYTLYGFLKMWDRWSAFGTSFRRNPLLSAKNRKQTIVTEIIDQIMDRSEATVAANLDTLDRQRETILESLTSTFARGYLPEVFSSSPEAFENASMRIKLDSRLSTSPAPLDISTSAGIFSIRHDGENLTVTRNDPVAERSSNIQAVGHAMRLYLRFLFPEIPSDPFLLSAERFGISLFYKELDFTKNQLVDLLQKLGDRKERDRNLPFFLVDDTLSRYALPVKDNITYTRNIPELRRKRSGIHEKDLSQNIRSFMKGYYTASDGEIQFRSAARGKNRFNIPLHLASSSARGLSDMYFFLRHEAQREHLLIIDEPESHLDTANQVEMARLLVRIVQTGMKVLLTTHSDYIIKEMNNLIMLSSSFRNKPAIVKKLGYDVDDFLEPERVHAYVTKKGGLMKCDVDRFGMNMPNFDETIDRINDASNELAARLTVQGDD